MISEEVKQELKALDRQYSYEHTVQLGRYHKDTDDEDKASVRERRDSAIKKSVRFHEHDPRHEWKQEKETQTLRAKFFRWRNQIRPALSWQNIKSMLIDWILLATLGIGMALLSMLIDNIIEYLNIFQLAIMQRSGEFESDFLSYLCTYLSWVGYTELLVLSSATFVHYVAPQAIGSGIPEMKTILRGVILKDYLTFKTFISKTVGLTFSLGSGIPIGKMGPFVHVASIAGNLLSNLASYYDGAYGNESRKSEMLSAACAVGVASVFSAPVGGVLLSIELTSSYFSVRNYWRGFFSAACGAAVFRLLRVFTSQQVTLVGFYQTSFPIDAFEPEELTFFAIIGVFSGFIGAFFIIFYRSVVMFLRQNDFAKRIFQTNWIVYPAVISFLVSSITYPRGYGRFLTGRFKFTQTVIDLFANCTFTKPALSPESPHGCSEDLLFSWTNHEGYGPYNYFVVVGLFAFSFLILSALCNTMPIPCGMFMPTFVVGAAFGRMFGEFISTIFPEGIPGGTDHPIFPGIYAVVGAAALTGAITKSVSVAVICCELTGQLVFLIPLMLSVIIANAVCSNLQPSIYDCIITIKHLPFLPDIPPSNSAVHLFTAEHIMVSPVRYLTRITTYMDIRNIIVEMPKIHSFPVVDDPTSMMLLGSIPKRSLLEMLEKQIGDTERKKEAARRIKLAIDTIDQHFKESLAIKFIESLEDETQKQHEPGSDPTSRKSSRVEDGITMKMPMRHAEKVTFDKEVDDHDQRREHEKANGGNERKSRFTIEPVTNEPLTPRKRTRTSSGGNANRPQIQRLRRNAFSSASIASTDDLDDVASVNSEGANTNKLHRQELNESFKNWYNNENSLTKNIADYIRNAKKRLHFIPKRKDTSSNETYDLFEEERRQWELERLNQEMEFDEKMIDPAPFQLVRRTSLYKVHSVFSLLGLNRAYVTERGRLVGVVALRDLRIAIQNAQNGVPLSSNSSSNTMSSDESNNVGPEIMLPDEINLESGDSLHKSNANGGISSFRTANDFEAPKHVVQEFKSALERRRRIRSGVDDVLTPALKVVNQSSASLHHLFTHPMLTIQEEDWPTISSRKSSLKSSNTTYNKGETDEHATILPIEPTTNLDSGVEPSSVAEALAYITNKGVNLEDLKALEDTLKHDGLIDPNTPK